MPRQIRIGDTVLLKARKSNELLANFRPSPCNVVQITGTEITIRNDAGEEFRRNTMFVKWIQERKRRCTASIFGLISVRQKRRESFVNNLLHPKPFFVTVH